MKPYYHDTSCPYLLQPVWFSVTQECPKQAAVEVIHDGNQEVLIKLKSSSKLQQRKKYTFDL